MVMGQSIADTEVLVIGAGPGGYVAAIRCAQLGYKVMLVDKAGEMGGMCLHHGCIPSKAFIHAMNVLYDAKTAGEMGISVENISLDFSKTQQWKQGVVEKLASGITTLCEKYGVQVVKAKVSFQNKNQALLEGEGLDFNVVEFRYCVIATGSRPREFPNTPKTEKILSSREVLELSQIPKTCAVIGGGYIGVELGVMLQKAGSQVTIIEAMPTILGAVEEDLAQVAKKRIEEIGITVKTETSIEAIEENFNAVLLKTSGGELSVDKVLVAIGHVPFTESLQLDLAGVNTNEKGFIVVNEEMRTSTEHIYAIGDVVGGVMLAHKAAAQGQVAAEVIAGRKVAFEPQVIPAVIFSDPEIATVGLREKEAREQYGDSIKIAKFPFAALGKALAIEKPDGFVKMISDENGVILGVHAVGPSVTDYISEAALAMEMGATAEDIALTIHPHPTLGEIMSEASEALLNRAIHIYQPKK